MIDIKKRINFYFDKALILDGAIPTISQGLIKEEFILYNLDRHATKSVIDKFIEITEKRITDNDLISELSFGQQLILSALIALLSNASKILFIDFFTSISLENRNKIYAIIDEEIKKRKVIEII